MIRNFRNYKCSRGFALVVTLSLMILLTTLAVGLLSLSSIALRQSGANSAQASAWLGLPLALAEPQKNAGDDRRVTANGSIVTGARQPEVMGGLKSWSPKLSKTPTASAPDYADPKKNNFVRWMVSGNEVDLTKPDWVTMPRSAVDHVKLFRQDSDGFLLQAAKVGVAASNGRGAFAWAVSQEATKAKLTVSGPEESQRVANDDLQAQPRPSLAVNSFFNQPDGAWNQRAAKVIDFNQVELDDSLRKDKAPTGGGARFTAVGAGLLTNGKSISGVRVIVIEDDQQSFNWGTIRLINVTPKPLAFRWENEARAVPTGWKPVDVSPGGKSRNMGILIYLKEDLKKPLYTAVWEHRVDMRQLVLVIPNPDESLGAVAFKFIPETRIAAGGGTEWFPPSLALGFQTSGISST